MPPMKLLLTVVLLTIACRQPQTPSQQADGKITGKVLPGAAVGRSGKIVVAAAATNQLTQIDWSKNRTVINQFGDFKITDLIAGKYYLAAFVDADNDDRLDRGEFWGGYDADGDGCLDAVTVIGGETTTVDIAMIARFE